MTATLPANFKERKPNISAQELIRVQSPSCKNGLLRKKGKGLTIGKWPRRFLVLSGEHIYVFADEMSKSPKSRFSLKGYNRVQRCEVKGYDWCFSILPAPNMLKEKEKTFCCINDKERKSWMRAIKNQIYTANSINKPTPTLIDKLLSKNAGDSDNDEDYVIVEESVYEPCDLLFTSTRKDSDDDSSDNTFETSSESDDDFEPGLQKKTRSNSVPHVTFYTDASSVSDTKPKDETRVRKFSAGSRPYDDAASTTSTGGLRPLPKPHVFGETGYTTMNAKRKPSDPMPKPPRYSEVCDEIPEHAYANLPKNSEDDEQYEKLPDVKEPSLESLCTLEEERPDRDRLIKLLQAKKKPGTYLIRKSRSGNEKVIAYLNDNGEVKEYKILGEGNGLTLDSQRYFESIEQMLYHYTNVEAIPKTSSFLKQGYHKM